jgi:hypothetical protein
LPIAGQICCSQVANALSGITGVDLNRARRALSVISIAQFYQNAALEAGINVARRVGPKRRHNGAGFVLSLPDKGFCKLIRASREPRS